MTEDFMARLRRVTQGFMEAKIVLLGVELKLFDRLAHGPAAVATLVEELEVTSRGVEILADALVASGYLRKVEGRYSNTPEVDRYLVRGSADSIAFITGHRNQMFRSWAQLDEVVRHGKQEREEIKATLTDRETNRNFILGMAEVSRGRVGPILDRLPLAGIKRFVDLGGGPAQYACEAVKRFPELQAELVDLPLTVEVARAYIAERGLQARVATRVCDFYREPELDLGEPADGVLISQVLHAEGPAENAALLARLARWVKPGGWVAVVENLVDPGRTGPPGAAMFAVNMLAGTVRGRTYTADEVREWMGDAGLVPEPTEEVGERAWLILGRAR